MKHNTFPLILLVLVLFSSAFAAEQIGTVTASGDFVLAGTQVPGSAARSVPLTSGDKVVTTMSDAAIMLEDGSRIVVDQNSALTLQFRGWSFPAGKVGEEMLLCLEAGAMRFSAAEDSRLVVCAMERQIAIQALSEGTVSIEGPQEVVAKVEKGAPVVVSKDATCTCESGIPLLPPVTKNGKATTVAVAVAAVGAGAGVGIFALTRGGGEPPVVISPSQP